MAVHGHSPQQLMQVVVEAVQIVHLILELVQAE
jgi:hypothetical protein